MESGCELLDRIAADIGGTALQVSVQLSEPIRIQVVGRAGVGRSAVADVLLRAGFGTVTESSAVDAPGLADPDLDGDVVVYVLSGAPRTPDVEALQRAPHGTTVALVNKADLQPEWASAMRVAAETEAETGVRALPIVGAQSRPEAPDGQDDVIAAVAAAERVARARRCRAALATLAEAAARGPDRDVLEGYLRSDEAVRLASQAVDAFGDGAADRRRLALLRRRWRVRTSTDVR
ncbi:hypothetical protein [Rhodococcus spongiicola]|uniref:G domain-containing protein n=1 Tax=Rhodococcus spongiicola TaxID=2487352 RepID=A0A3S3ZIW8_9NOCA|nr:hypothetical protein [Rhodococcus spongiicola]RVW01762.1 hypothetical protein EF834_15375 [Rhodococcus spongiicola]